MVVVIAGWPTVIVLSSTVIPAEASTATTSAVSIALRRMNHAP